jgi:CBS-domain-containing membrane protein
MEFLSCLHPPSSATALLMVLVNSQFHGMHWYWAIAIVAINVGISLSLALVINNLLPRKTLPDACTPHANPTQARPVHGARAG